MGEGESGRMGERAMGRKAMGRKGEKKGEWAMGENEKIRK